jgi:UDP-N-acetylglucosamine:LPS N-acetylglucosamine transferase
MQNAAIMIEEKEFNAEKLYQVLCQLRDDPSHLKDLGVNIHKSLKRGAREEISAHLLKHL